MHIFVIGMGKCESIEEGGLKKDSVVNILNCILKFKDSINNGKTNKGFLAKELTFLVTSTEYVLKERKPKVRKKSSMVFLTKLFSEING